MGDDLLGRLAAVTDEFQLVEIGVVNIWLRTF